MPTLYNPAKACPVCGQYLDDGYGTLRPCPMNHDTEEEK